MAKTWIESTWPGYALAVERDTYAWDTFTGEAEDKAEAAARAMADDSDIPEPRDDTSKVPVPKRRRATGPTEHGTYLRRRSQGEHVDNFRERAAISRFPMHMFSLVTAFEGSLAEVADKAVVEPGLLGLASDEGAPMFTFARDCDGKGTNLGARMNEAAERLAVSHRLTYGVLPPVSRQGSPRFLLFDTASVRDFWPRNGDPLEWLIVSEEVAVRSGPRSDETTRTEYILYTLDGWQRYTVERDDGDAESMVRLLDEGAWSRRFRHVDGRERLPFGRHSLNLKFHVGYRTARGNIHLYNLFSDIRNLIRVANHPAARGKDLTEDQFLTTLAQRRRGANAFWGDWDYINPDPSNADVGYRIYQNEVTDWYMTSLQQFNEAASGQSKTALQVTEDARGRRAFLSLLTEALDEIENDVRFLASQIVAPDAAPQAWMRSQITRSKDFRAIDPEALAESRTMRLGQWINYGFARKTALVHGAGRTEAEAEAILREDLRARAQDPAALSVADTALATNGQPPQPGRGATTDPVA